MFVIAAALCLGFRSCSVNQQSITFETDYPYYGMETKQEGLNAMSWRPDDLTELEDFAPIILKGVLSDDAQHRTIQSVEPRTLTVSTFTITDVYKGELKKGDVIEVSEFYHVETEGGKQILYQMDGYMPIAPGLEFVVFLEKYPILPMDGWENTYTPCCHQLGRYIVPSANTVSADNIDSMTIQELYLSEESSLYRELFEEVAQKYM